MGLFSSARSWRAPLQLIDCWLPEPGSATRTGRSGAGDHQVLQPRAQTGQPSATVQRFARAGWLGRPAANAPRLDDPTDPHGGPAPADRSAGAAHPAPRSAAHRRAGARVVLSGRMDQVCAELERLAALEEALQRAA